MSSRKDDKSRFHRERKPKIAGWTRTRDLLKGAATQPGSVDGSAGRTPGMVSV